MRRWIPGIGQRIGPWHVTARDLQVRRTPLLNQDGQVGCVDESQVNLFTFVCESSQHSLEIWQDDLTSKHDFLEKHRDACTCIVDRHIAQQLEHQGKAQSRRTIITTLSLDPEIVQWIRDKARGDRRTISSVASEALMAGIIALS